MTTSIGWDIAALAFFLIASVILFFVIIARNRGIGRGTTRKNILVWLNGKTGRMGVDPLKHTMRGKYAEHQSEGEYNIVYTAGLFKSRSIEIEPHALRYFDKFNTFIFNKEFVKWINNKLLEEIELTKLKLLKTERNYEQLLTEVNELKTKPEAVIKEKLEQITKLHKDTQPPQFQQYPKK